MFSKVSALLFWFIYILSDILQALPHRKGIKEQPDEAVILEQVYLYCCAIFDIQIMLSTNNC